MVTKHQSTVAIDIRQEKLIEPHPNSHTKRKNPRPKNIRHAPSLTTVQRNHLPFVTVIVPVYNDERRIGICIEKLLEQTYPKKRYEIIIIDNKSTDKSMSVIRTYPVKVLSETAVQSSYAARNKGIRNAQGEIIAFTDSDCQPTKRWIENGVRSLLRNKADLVAGGVSFLFTNKSNPYEIYDSLYHLQQEELAGKGMSTTANLFCRKEVFDKFGLFPNSVRSGGDTTWTYAMTKKGVSLIYEGSARVYHPTRTREEIFEKKHRVGYGQIPLWREQKHRTPLYIKLIIGFLPPLRIKYGKMENRSIKSILQLYCVSYACNLRTSSGRLSYLHDSLRKRKG